MIMIRVRVGVTLTLAFNYHWSNCRSFQLGYTVCIIVLCVCNWLRREQEFFFFFLSALSVGSENLENYGALYTAPNPPPENNPSNNETAPPPKQQQTNKKQTNTKHLMAPPRSMPPPLFFFQYRPISLNIMVYFDKYDLDFHLIFLCSVAMQE